MSLVTVPTYRPGVRSLPLCVSVGLLFLTLRLQGGVGNLIPGPLSFINLVLWLLQALKPRHSLLYGHGPPSGGSLNTPPQPTRHLVVGLDPGLLDCQPDSVTRDTKYGSASLRGGRRELRPPRAPCPTCGAQHCMGTLQQWTGAPASSRRRSSSPPVPCPVCSCPDLV
jgi:hypothetical protein